MQKLHALRSWTLCGLLACAMLFAGAGSFAATVTAEFRINENSRITGAKLIRRTPTPEGVTEEVHPGKVDGSRVTFTDLPADEKHRIWYRSTDYSRFVHSELGRRREMGVRVAEAARKNGTEYMCRPD